MPQFFCKLLPPRPTFGIDMTEAERALMVAHAAYVKTFFDTGQVLAFGPVMSAEGAIGIALLEFPDEAAARAFLDQDPTLTAGLMRYELSPMRIAASQASRGI